MRLIPSSEIPARKGSMTPFPKSFSSIGCGVKTPGKSNSDVIRISLLIRSEKFASSECEYLNANERRETFDSISATLAVPPEPR